jgi:hypothetical protein
MGPANGYRGYGYGHGNGPYSTGAYANGGQPEITLVDLPNQATSTAWQAAYEAERIREAARRETDMIRREASKQVAEMLEAAEIEAAEIRRAAMSMQAELGEFSANITNTLPSPVRPQTPPPPRTRPRTTLLTRPRTPARPRARPSTVLLEEPAEELIRRQGARPTGRHRARPTGRHRARAAGGHRARPAERPTAGPGRQVAATRVTVVATSALFLVAVVAGAGVTEMHLHGFAFFASRATGACETGHSGLRENQGPGQPDAPKSTPSLAKDQPSPLSTVIVHNGQSS